MSEYLYICQPEHWNLVEFNKMIIFCECIVLHFCHTFETIQCFPIFTFWQRGIHKWAAMADYELDLFKSWDGYNSVWFAEEGHGNLTVRTVTTSSAVMPKKKLMVFFCIHNLSFSGTCKCNNWWCFDDVLACLFLFPQPKKQLSVDEAFDGDVPLQK